ncbi:hypothetical protein B0A49_08740 [Cryomyces minteri]|uniref:Uncharacterized protein n=2 Tax=Cryomyces minteri TaxID=331657 RepID=A0A4U0W6Q6_9PEZI|nr:hypothetical protein B0A49_13114 [Cryomyces minteri]TKA65318.1 hypothetical protein B0A49_08740 [Cryomyces minteri]
MLSQLLYLTPLLSLVPSTSAQGPPLSGHWTLTDIVTSGPNANAGNCATCWPGDPHNTVSFTILETNSSCTTTWLPPNKPTEYVTCTPPAYFSGLPSEFAFKFPVGEQTSFFAFTPEVEFTYQFQTEAGPEETLFKGEIYISEATSNLFCLSGTSGTGLKCSGGPVSVEIR